MNKIKRRNLVFIGIFALIIFLGATTYAFFNYTRTGLTNNLETGTIYFNSNQNGNINMTNAFPMTSSEAEEANLDSVTVDISGNTSYADGEEFLITFVDVTNTINNKKVPINYIATYVAKENKTIGSSNDDYFDARESKNANIYLLNGEGDVHNGKQVLVGYVDNEGNGIEGTLTIKAYFDAERMAITDTYNGPQATPTAEMGTSNEWVDGREVFTTSEWNSRATPIGFKIKAESNEGIWVEEESTPKSCFTTSPARMSYVISSDISTNQTKLDACVAIFQDEYFQTSQLREEYCLGTYSRGENPLQYMLYSGYIDQQKIDDLLEAEAIVEDGYVTDIVGYDENCGTDVIVPNKINVPNYLVNPNINSNNITNCVDVLTDLWGPEENVVNSGETYHDFCAGTGTINSSTLQRMLEDYWSNGYSWHSEEESNALLNAGVLINNPIPSRVVKIIGGEYNDGFEAKDLTSIQLPSTLKIIDECAFCGNQLTNITIPNGVLVIKDSAFGGNNISSLTIPSSVMAIGSYALRNMGLESVTLGNNIQYIGDYAFSDNRLTNVDIPNSVSDIGRSVFTRNRLISATVGNGITSIGDSAFSKNSGNTNLASITIDKNCSFIKSLYGYPWINTGFSGTTVYGSGGEVCDAY